MSDNSDLVLRSLFDRVRSQGDDEAFVAGVTRKIAMRRRVRSASQLLGGLVLLVLLVFVSPILIDAANYVAVVPGLLMGYFGSQFNPAGLVLSMLGSVLVAFRAVA